MKRFRFWLDSLFLALALNVCALADVIDDPPAPVPDSSGVPPVLPLSIAVLLIAAAFLGFKILRRGGKK